MDKPHIYRSQGCWAVKWRGKGLIWRGTQDFSVVCEGLRIWMTRLTKGDDNGQANR